MDNREWLFVTHTMGVKLPDGRRVIVRRGDRVLSAMGADGMPRTLSVIIQIAKD